MSQKHEYFGKYILLERLAAGGMAEVWLARAPGAGGIGKFVAIKKILAQYSDNTEFIQMFRDEAAIAMHLSHSNIVAIYEFGQEKSQLFLVLDYVEGRNLRQILNKMKTTQHRFSMDQVCYVIKEVAAGLDHAHRCLDSATGKPLNITHRDMSPQNVMISFEGEVRIIDFGIAKAANQLENTKTGTLKGKFGYMSPEQVEGHSTDLRTDIFSLGIALWELLANDRLFIANNELNTLRKIRDCQVPSLTKINPNIDPELDRIVMKALTRDRNLRYQTAAALHRDLNRFLNRQYPDFTPHDFAVFIKTMYADEILDTRKRLIEYSKIPFQNQLGKQKFESNDDDRTVVTSFEQRESLSAKTQSIENTEDGWLTSGQQGSTNSESLSKNTDNEITVSATKTFGDSSSVPDINLENSQKTGSTEKPSFLDISSMKADLEQKSNANSKSYDNEGSDSSIEMASISHESSGRATLRPRQAIKVKKKESSGLLRLVLSISAGVCLYLAIENIFPEQLRMAETQARNSLEAFLNNISPALKQTTTTAQAPIQEAPPAQLPEESEVSEVSSVAPAKPSLRTLIVQSVPSGAEIFIDGKSIGDTTPSRIEIPTDKKVEISLKKDRYVEYVKANFDAATFDQSSFRATLQKALVGYLDIDVRPSRNVKIYVNGVSLEERNLPIYKYAVPAGSEITVSAINTISGEEIKEKLTLYEDQRKSIILKLNNKRNRTPSNFE